MGFFLGRNKRRQFPEASAAAVIHVIEIDDEGRKRLPASIQVLHLRIAIGVEDACGFDVGP